MPANQQKLILWDYADINALSDDYRIYALTDKQVSALLLVSAWQMGWHTRWLNATDSQAYEFANAVTGQLLMPLDICQLVADCITDSDLVEQSINNLINNSTLINQTLQQIGAGPAPFTQASDLDVLWGASLSLASWIQTSIVDTAEGVKATAELFESVAVALGITGFGDIVLDNLVDFVGNVIATGAPQIEAEADTGSLEKLACYIFNRLRCFESSTFSYDALKDNLIDLAISVGVPKPNYYAALLAFFDLNAPSAFYRYWDLGLNDPSNDHTTLCGPCTNVWNSVLSDCTYFDDWVGESDNTFTCTGGIYSGKRMTFTLTFPDTFITDLESTTWQGTPVDNRARYFVRFLYKGSIVVEVGRDNGAESAGETDTTINVSAVCDEIIFSLRSVPSDRSSPSLAEIRALEITGTGSKPTGLF